MISRNDRTGDGRVRTIVRLAGLMEPLEPRRLLASDFASVGLLFELDAGGDLGAETFLTEGTLADDGSATGEMFDSAEDGRRFDEGLEYSRVTNLPDGRFERSPDRGRLADPNETNGAQFLRQDGSGWWYAQRRGEGVFGDEFAQEIEYLVERPDTATLTSIEGVWRFSLVGVDFDENEPFGGTGTLTISGSNVTWTVDVGSVARSSSLIESTGPRGQFISTDQEFFYLSRDGQSIVFADMAERDDLIFTGVAVRADASVAPERLAGGYFLTWAAAGEAAEDIRGDDIGFAQRFLDLEPGGVYRLYDLDEYDDGERDALSSGTWTISGSRLILDVGNTDELLNFTISDGGETILGTDWDDSEFVDPVVGLGVRAGGPLITAVNLAVPAPTPAGAEAVYQLRDQGRWFVADLVQESGSPAVEGDFVTWRDDRDGRVYAAGRTAQGDVILFTQTERGLWGFRNLTQETAADGSAAQRIAGDVELMVAPNDVVNIVGLAADGDLVRFFDTGVERPVDLGGGFDWDAMNLSEEQLAPGGQATPAFAGELVAYATSWGGLNIAGLDAQGRIFSVWWAPGVERWQASNLTELYDAPMLAGGLTVYLTPWNGINIAGVDPEGQLRVTWWVPQFVDTWFNSNITAEIGGPPLSPESLASFVSPWGGLNVSGIAQETGEIITYWWSPERVDLGWAATSLTAITPGAPADLTGPLTGASGPGSALNVFAFNQEDELVRLFWQPEFGGEWRFENVHELAIPTV